MKKQISEKQFSFIVIIVFSISILSINNSCSKETNSADGKSATLTGATIIYTDVNPDSVILKSFTDTFKLDLNSDGVNDFMFLRSYKEDRCGDGLLGSFAWDNNLSVMPANGSHAIMTNRSNLPPTLDSSTAISPDSSWATTSQVLLYGAANANGHCITSLPKIQGYWLNVSDKYIGLKFNKGNNTYYGWARFTSTYHVDSRGRNLLVLGNFIIKDYAYNSTPNQPILAGQTK